jgi:hypothetical protein
MDPQADYKKLIESAQRSQSVGQWAVLVGLVFILLALLYGCYEIHRKGLKISQSRTLTGRPATVVAVLMAVAAVGMAVCGAMYLGMFR